MARLRGEADGGSEEAPEYEAPRRELLPDIEEINSTLQGGRRGGGTDTTAASAEHRRGFRLGFVASVGVAALMILAYAWAPSIASAVPAAEGAIIAYVDAANAARDALDGLLGTR